MIKIKILWGFSLLLLCFYVMERMYDKQSIVTIFSFQDALFEDLDVNDLVIFDIDDTLIHPLDAYIAHEFDHSLIVSLFKIKLMFRYPVLFNPEQEAYYRSIMYKTSKRELVEREVISIIKQLKSRKIPVIACTYMNTGPFGIINKMEEWRFKDINSLGLNFEKTFDIKNMPIQGFFKHPIFYKGILCTDLTSKGKVIGRFLDQIHFKPSKIIMFDDRIEHLLDIQCECKKRGIQYKGYHYKGVCNKQFNESLAWFQFKKLIDYNIWLSDEIALTLQKTTVD